MKKIWKLVLISFVALALTACSNGGKTGEGKTYNIGLAIYQYDDNFMTEYRTELVKYFAELGEKDGNTYKVDMQDGKKDQANQTEQIKNFIAQKHDLIIANLVDTTGAENIINLSKAADIPVVFINREPEPEVLKVWPGKTTYVGADATQSGTFQGEIINALASKGDVNGDGVVNFITLLGDPGNVDAQQRTEFSIRALNDANNKNNPLAAPFQADWDTAKGEQFTRTALGQFGKDLEVVFANNDGMAIGAVTAIEAADRKVGEDIYVVGVDAIPDALELIKEGRLTGTVLNDHFNQSHTAADVSLELLQGKEVAAYFWHDYVKVTKAEDAVLVRKDAKVETVEEVLARYAKR